MAARLGHVLWWAGNLVGGLLMLGGAILGLTDNSVTMTPFLHFVVPGAAIFLNGQACRYVLAGGK